MNTETTKKKAEFIDKNPHFTTYGKGDSAFSMSYLKHMRDGNFQGYKINLTGTNNLFKDKTSIYIEGEEIIELLTVLLGLNNSCKFQRNKKISNTDKSIEFSWYNGNLFVKVDEKNMEPLRFILKNIEKMIMYKLSIYTLRLHFIHAGTKFTEKELVDLVKELNQGNNKNPSTQETSKSIDKDKSSDSNGYKVTYVNTYNNKDYSNTLSVPKEVYEFIKDQKKFKQLISDEKSIMTIISKIKDNIIDGEAKFLNKNNVSTLRIG